jgi:hypothetical protein
MAATSETRKPTSKTVRASVGFPERAYAQMEKLAAAKKVSLAWVVREAVDKYLEDQWPLFPKE